MLLLVLLACGAKGNLATGDDGAPLESDGDTGTAGTPSDTGTPAYWTLDASLAVVAGLPRTGEASFVSVELLDAASNPLCAVTLPLKSAVTKASPDEAIYGWWLLSLEADDACDSGIDSVLLGVGEMNADVEAAIPAGGYDAALASSFNGAYFGATAETQWAFGIAWPAGTLGDGSGVDGPPVPDGTWLVASLFPFPL